MKKSLLVVCLAAGAFLLPSLATAGVVNGVCVNCHTMHNSQNNTAINATGAQPNLLAGTGCVGCHATGATNNAAGVGGAYLAPQVDDGTNTNNGGYFATTNPDSYQHNVADFAAENADVDLTTVPGGTGTTDNAGSPVLGCQGCHTIAGHHGTGTSYRMLAGTWADSVADADYGTTTGGNGLGNRAGTTYDAEDINSLCGSCHTDFHTMANQAVDGTGAINLWLRHPTDISIATVFATGQAPSVAAAVTSSDAVPVGTTTGVGTDVVMCLSCHNAHGSNYADILAWDYNQNIASSTGGTVGVGCESCHAYGAAGM